MASQCVDVITKSTQCPLAFVGISVTKFVPSKESGSFLKFFKNAKPKDEVTIFESFGEATNSTSSSEAKGEMPSTIVNNKEVCSLKNERQKSQKIKESIAKNNERTMKGSKRLVSNLNMSTEDSPSSKRVSKLIQVCNERDKAKNKRLSGVTIDNNDFQGSFFMNVYKTEEKKCYNDENVDIVEESKCRKQLIAPSADDENTDDYNTDLQEDACGTSSTSHMHTRISSNNEELTEKSNGRTSAQDPSVRLREIFPNLADIDPDILSLLPADLQEEARLHMKSHSKTSKQENVKVARELSKAGRGRPSKSKLAGKSGKRRSPLYNFLIKTNTGEHDVPLERCAECNQMIPITKFSEHVDFHVAQNLYQEINKPTSSENGGAKRKLEERDDEDVFVKRPTSNVCKPDGNS